MMINIQVGYNNIAADEANWLHIKCIIIFLKIFLGSSGMLYPSTCTSINILDKVDKSISDQEQHDADTGGPSTKQQTTLQASWNTKTMLTSYSTEPWLEQT